MVLEAAEHCRALRQTLEAPPSIRRKPRRRGSIDGDSDDDRWGAPRAPRVPSGRPGRLAPLQEP